jgi:hypothetical protein
MGYTTDFEGTFKFNKRLDPVTLRFLKKFNDTRRMGRKGLSSKYGVEGEFYVGGKGWAGQDRDESVIDYNKPPRTQPGLWCQWRPTEDGRELAWDGNEKFYEYIPWLEYLIEKVLSPKGYSLTGVVKWQGEDPADFGVISVKDNKIEVVEGVHFIPKKKKEKDYSGENRVKYKKLMKKLWNLAGEVGTLGEKDERYSEVYTKLADALDIAELNGLIQNEEV